MPYLHEHHTPSLMHRFDNWPPSFQLFSCVDTWGIGIPAQPPHIRLQQADGCGMLGEFGI